MTVEALKDQKTESLKDQESETLPLLGPDEDFLITGTGKSFTSRVNVTYRKPIDIDGVIVPVEVTTLVRVGEMENLRLESLDGNIYVLSDDKDNAISLHVENERIGRALIRALVIERNDPYEEISKKHVERVTERLGLNKNLADYQEFLVAYAPSIAILCSMAMTLSVCVWLLFL